jgi:hypothetical protein
LTHSGPFGGPALATWVIAFGYTRAELLDVLRDPQTDPYHIPRYQGLPDRIVRETWVRGTAISGTLETAISASDATGALYGRIYIGPGRSWTYVAPTSQLVQFAAEALFELDVWSDRWQPVILNMMACGPAELLANPDGSRTIFFTDTSWQTESCQHPNFPALFSTQTAGEVLGDFDRAPYLADISDQAVTTWVDLDARGRLLRVEVRAGTARDGALLESWELAQDELLTADQVPAAAFDSSPPKALLRWRTAGTTISQPLLQDTVTLTDALALARSPLFGLPGGESATTLTDTAALSATLVAIEAGTRPAEEAPSASFGDEAPFLSALLYGYALRLTYNFPEAPLLYIYEGPAKELGAYLRATAHWRSSTPVTLDVGGRKISGWQVTTAPNDTWTLFEIDDTLIAVWYPAERAAEVIAALRPIARP